MTWSIRQISSEDQIDDEAALDVLRAEYQPRTDPRNNAARSLRVAARAVREARPRRRPDHRAGASAGPGAAFRRPQPLACLVLEADVGAQVALLYRAHRVLPYPDRGIVAFHRLAHRDLAGPAVPAHQSPGALDGVADVEQLADQRLDPAQGPPLVPGEPVRQRPFARL
jgi:hypothetical protein